MLSPLSPRLRDQSAAAAASRFTFLSGGLPGHTHTTRSPRSSRGAALSPSRSLLVVDCVTPCAQLSPRVVETVALSPVHLASRVALFSSARVSPSQRSVVAGAAVANAAGRASALPPDSLLFGVLPFLTAKEISRCAQVSKDWNACARDPELWRGLCQRRSIHAARKRSDCDWRAEYARAARMETERRNSQRWSACVAVCQWLCTLLLLLSPFALGAAALATQHIALSSFQPVPFTVLESQVHFEQLDGWTFFTPLVRVQYTVHGLTHMADESQLFPPTLLRWDALQHGVATKEWAEDVVRRLAAAPAIFVNARDPTDCFLLRERQSWPYMLALAGLALLCVLVYNELYHCSRDSVRPADRQLTYDPQLGGSLFELRARAWVADLLGDRGKSLVGMTVCALSIVTSAALAVQVFLSDEPVPSWMTVLGLLLVLQGCWARLLRQSLLTLLQSRLVGDVRAFLLTPTIQRGTATYVAVAHTVKQSCIVQGLRVSLHCYRTDRTLSGCIASLTCPATERIPNTATATHRKLPSRLLHGVSLQELNDPAANPVVPEPSTCDCELSFPLCHTATDHAGHVPARCPYATVADTAHPYPAGSTVLQVCEVLVPTSDAPHPPAGAADPQPEHGVAALALPDSSLSPDSYPIFSWFLRVQLTIRPSQSVSPSWVQTVAQRLLGTQGSVVYSRDTEVMVGSA